MGEDDHWRAGRERSQILLEPLELILTQRAHALALGLEHVDQADKVSALVLEALPAPASHRCGTVEAYATAERGFNVILWRRGGLGYVLVSDVDGRELRQLAARLAGGR